MQKNCVILTFLIQKAVLQRMQNMNRTLIDMKHSSISRPAEQGAVIGKSILMKTAIFLKKDIRNISSI